MSCYPNDFVEKTLEDLLLENPRNGLTKPKSIRGKGVKMVGMGELFAQPRITDIEMERVPVTEAEIKKYSLQKDDLLFARQSLVLEGAGKCGIIEQVNEPTVFESHLIRVRVDSHVVNASFLFYWFNSVGRQVILSIISRVAAAGIRSSELVTIKISLPPIHEQTAIAAALSDTDALIESLEKLIAKKQAVKQGAMQELLTGKRRLKGFSGEWKYRKFVDTFDFLPNNTYARNQMTDTNGNYINIHYGDVLIKYDAVLDLERDEVPYLIDGIKITNRKMLAQDGDVVIADTAEDNTVGKMIELFHVGNRKVVAGLHTILCRPKYDEFSPCWLGYFMNSTTYHNQLLPFITGIKVSSIAKNNIGETMIAIPSKHEQQAIAQILTDMDNEISALQKKLDKVRRIKQGMMAELLTGRIRLI